MQLLTSRARSSHARRSTSCVSLSCFFIVDSCSHTHTTSTQRDEIDVSGIDEIDVSDHWRPQISAGSAPWP
jgi:hypothetical protein